MCIDPLNSVSVSSSDYLANAVSEKVAPVTVNVDNAIELGRSQMVEFE